MIIMLKQNKTVLNNDKNNDNYVKIEQNSVI